MITRRTNWLLSTALVALLTLLSNPSKAQQNILYLWVDTVVVEAGQSDAFLDVKYRLDIQQPPVDFSGYSARVVYGPQTDVNVISVHLENTASRNFPDPIVNTSLPGEVRVAALGAAVDLSYSTLFRLRVNVKPGLLAGEQAQFLWAEMQLSDFSGIDSVVLGQGMIERKKPIDPEPTPDSVLVKIPGITVFDTTSFALPVHFNEMSGSNVKHLVLSFDFDSSVIVFDSASLMPGITEVTIEEVIQPTHADVFLQSIDTNRIKGDGDVFMLHFRSVLRADTVCTMVQPTIQALNSDHSIDYKSVDTATICVNGTYVPVDTTSKVVRGKQASRLRVSPNPLQESTTFTVEGYQGMFTVRIFDLSGSEIYNGTHFGIAEWEPTGLAKGVYHARIDYGDTVEVVKLILE